MGMFDYLYCKVPLPAPGCEGMEFQTKDTPMQFLNRYEIREDGALWWLAAHVESVSAPEPRGLMRFFGPKPPTTRTTHCWEHEPGVTGEVMFYGTTRDGRWVEFVADFVDGQLQQLRCILDEPESFGTP